MLNKRLVRTAELVLEQFNDLDDISVSSKQIRDSIGTTLQVWRHDGVLLFGSGSAPEERMGVKQQGFENATLNGISYRVYSHWDEAKNINVRVGEHYELRSEEHTSELQSRPHLVCRLLLEKKKKKVKIKGKKNKKKEEENKTKMNRTIRQII